jgi:MFS family permease
VNAQARLAGVLFIVSIPMISLARGYSPLVLGRLLQGVSGGLIGVVVPLYLAECLNAAIRGKGTAIFQWLLTLGILAAALVGMYFSIRVEAVAKLGAGAQLFAFKDTAWRSIFWVSELMPTRIRSHGMSVALLINQAVSTIIAALFLPTVGKYGYSVMFFTFAACTVIYFIAATLFLPETRGKTLEQIEKCFAGRPRPQRQTTPART